MAIARVAGGEGDQTAVCREVGVAEPPSWQAHPSMNDCNSETAAQSTTFGVREAPPASITYRRTLPSHPC